MERSLQSYLLNQYQSRIPEFNEKPENRPFIQAFNPSTYQVWPHFFDYENLPPIPEAPLREQPKSRKQDTSFDFLSKYSLKQDCKSPCLSQVALSQLGTPTCSNLDDGVLSMSTRVDSLHAQTGLSQQLLGRIEGRQMRDEELRKRNEEAIKSED